MSTFTFFRCIAVCSLAIPLTVFGQAVPELMYYKFDAPGSTTINSASAPVGNNPSNVVGMNIGGVGQFGSALLGTGSSSSTNHVDNGWATNLVNTDWTISFWINNVPASATLYYLFGDGGNSMRCFVNGAPGQGNMRLNGTGFPTNITVTGVTGGEHVIHFVRTVTPNEILVYKDGVFQSSYPIPGTLTVGTGFRIGGYTTNTGLLGELDEFRMYNRALSASEIALTWNVPLPFNVTNCAGTPGSPAIATPPLGNPKCVGDSVSINASDTNFTTGITFQWEEASVITGPYSNVSTGSGATSLYYTSGPLNADTYFRLRVTCTNSGMSSYSDTFSVAVIVPQLNGTTSDSRCGPGTVTLQASAGPGNTIFWFDQPNGGTLLDTGATYSPFVFNTTNFYARAGNAQTQHVGIPNIIGNTGNTGVNIGIRFDAYVNLIVDSVAIYPIGTGPGTVTIDLRDVSNTVLDQVTINTTGIAAPGIKTWVPVNFAVPAGNDYRIIWSAKTGGVTTLGRETTAFSFPYTWPGIISLTNSTTAGFYYYFYDWVVTAGCLSNAQPATATVIPSDPININPAVNPICDNQSTTITISSSNSNYQYNWTPATGLNTSTGANVISSVDNTITYTVTAHDASTDCAAIDTVQIVVNPSPQLSVTPPDTAICPNHPVQFLSDALGLTPSVQIGFGTTSNTATATANPGPYAGFSGGSRQQYLYLASDLQAAGFTAGVVDFIEFEVVALNNAAGLSDYTISMDHTNDFVLTTLFTAGLPVVSFTPSYQPVAGWNHHNVAGFSWDGVSNVLVEICFNNNNAGYGQGNASVYYQATTGQNTVTYYRNNNDPSICINPTGTASVNRPNIRFGRNAPITYSWSPVTGLSDPTIANPVLTTGTSDNYVLMITDQLNNCSNHDTIEVLVHPLPVVDLGADTSICSNSAGFFLDVTGSGQSYVWQDNTTSPTQFVNDAGLYWVQVTNAQGCINTDSIQVGELMATSVDINVDVTGMNTAILDAGPGFASYVWSNLQTTQSITITGSGMYWVTVQDNNGCSSTDTITLVFTLDIDTEGDLAATVSYYPNPSQGIVNFMIEGLYADKVRMDVLDMTGRQHYSQVYSSVENILNGQINLTNLANGTYFIRLTTGNHSHVSQIVITK